MASIFKRGRDKGKKRSCWYIEYTDHLGNRRRKKGFTDKGLTEQLAAKLENECLLRKQGLIDASDEAAKKRKNSPIEEHLAAFESSISRGDNTEKYVKLVMARLRRIVNEAGIERPSEIDFESVETVLREMVESGEIGNKTFNHYVQAMDQFCRWLSHGQRQILPSNPIAGMARLNTGVDVRHQRRALKAEEFAKLVESARTSYQEIQCFDGEDRARIYLISYYTGLRRKEIGSLTPNSFDLNGNPATVTVQAACSKHRRKDVLPLHDDLVAMLKEWLPGKAEGEVLFPNLGKRRTWLMVKKDLERVGIPYETSEGIADFHAAGRHTHITELLRNGATLPQARELARHCDVRMTMKYTHIGIDDQAKALKFLPSTNGKSNGSQSGQHSNGSESPSAAEDDHEEHVGDTPERGSSSGNDDECLEAVAAGGEGPNTETGFDSRRLQWTNWYRPDRSFIFFLVWHLGVASSHDATGGELNRMSHGMRRDMLLDNQRPKRNSISLPEPMLRLPSTSSSRPRLTDWFNL